MTPAGHRSPKKLLPGGEEGQMGVRLDLELERDVENGASEEDSEDHEMLSRPPSAWPRYPTSATHQFKVVFR